MWRAEWRRRALALTVTVERIRAACGSEIRRRQAWGVQQGSIKLRRLAGKMTN